MPDQPIDPLEKQLGAANQRPWIRLAVIALFMAVQIKSWWEPGCDASSYLSIARNMADGQLQRLDSAHLRWAPGYPVLIAPAVSASFCCWLSCTRRGNAHSPAAPL